MVSHHKWYYNIQQQAEEGAKQLREQLAKRKEPVKIPAKNADFVKDVETAAKIPAQVGNLNHFILMKIFS